MTEPQRYRTPSDCPVCGNDVVVTRLGCRSCGAELAGEFDPCPYCSLDAADAQTLSVFLASRGNLREVAKHLGVSYPTARQRLTDLLVTLGLSGEAQPTPDLDRASILDQVAAGTLDPQEAAALLA